MESVPKHSVGTFKKPCGIMLVSNIILQNFDCVQNLKQHVLYDPVLKVVGIYCLLRYIVFIYIAEVKPKACCTTG